MTEPEIIPSSAPAADTGDSPWFAIVNPHAGSGRTLPLWRESELLMRELGVRYDFAQTDCRFHATELAYNAARDGRRHFIAAGGDGTIHEVITGIMLFVEESRISGGGVSLEEFFLGVIPIGSGNDWIRSHGIRNDIGEAVRLLSEGSFARQDVVKVSLLASPEGNAVSRVSYVANVAGIGFDARICDRVNRQKDAGKSGRLLYVKAFIYNFFKYHPMSVEVICDGKTAFAGDCFSIAFGIGKYSGGGFRQTPDAVLDDGLLDVTIIPSLPKPYIMSKAPKLLDGSLLSVPQITSHQVKSVIVKSLYSAPEMVEADGEIIGSVPVRLDVMPGQINVMQGRHQG